MSQKKYDEKELIEELQKLASELDKTPTVREVQDCEYLPSKSTIERYFGTHNEFVQAAGLEPNMEVSDSLETKPKNIDIPDDKEWTELSPYQRWYYKNKDREQKRLKNRKERIKKWFQEYKAKNLNCKECGNGHPAVIDLHHPESDEKRIPPSDMVRRGWSKDRIIKKIEEDLEVLCANCHRKIHYPEKKYSYTEYEE